jgi:hypothetical protein
MELLGSRSVSGDDGRKDFDDLDDFDVLDDEAGDEQNTTRCKTVHIVFKELYIFVEK